MTAVSSRIKYIEVPAWYCLYRTLRLWGLISQQKRESMRERGWRGQREMARERQKAKVCQRVKAQARELEGHRASERASEREIQVMRR
eukprot:3285598-Rhodomonas_salina.1